MKHKTMPAAVKALPAGGDDYTFEAIVSVFNNIDSVGDVVRPGAFQKSLNAWKSAGDPIPVYWSHRMDDPTYNIGFVQDAKELAGGSPEIPDWAGSHVKLNGGLYVKAQLDDYGLGAHVHTLLKQRRVKQFSFSYDVVTERPNKAAGTNDLLELMVHEIGPTPVGCNQLTELIGAKSEAPPPKITAPAALIARRCEQIARRLTS